MNTQLIEEAIQKAIDGGAVQAPPIPGMHPDSDLNFIRAQTDIEIEPTVLERYISDLKRDPQMALFDYAFATVPTGGGVSMKLPSVARLLLARAIASGDVGATVELFRSYIEKNSASVIAVMAVSGAKTAKNVRLGPDIQLMPMTSLPRSVQRGGALSQEQFHPFAVRSAISCALVTTLEFTPVFYRINEGGIPSKKAQQRITDTLHHLDEARTLLSLLGIPTAFRKFWVQPKDLLMSAGFNSGQYFSPEVVRGQDVEVDEKAAEELAAAYFRIDHVRRNKTLRVPLDRLDRAARDYDFADKSIDLGIALEALLLHELDGQDRGELKFRLGLRGAWLGGNDEKERAAIQTALGKMYDLRSRAVHSGTVERNEKNREIVRRGTALCRQLIRKTIDAEGRINWNTLVLGGRAAEIPGA